MFPIDSSLLPSLATRKALLVVDAQNDFLAEDGALPARLPIGLPQRIADLANGFRGGGGDIIWVQSQFESPRPVDNEQIMVSDTRGRRARTPAPASDGGPPNPAEAFLSSDDAAAGPMCVRRGAPGTEMHPSVKQAVRPRDHVLSKSFYSAFKSDELLRLLRVRFVTELFICGSSTNVGVMATAIDAARYGFIITIVDDCCGSQTMIQHRTALRQITNTTGCDVLPAATVLARMSPGPAPNTTVRVSRGKRDGVVPSASDIQSSLERLSLSGDDAAASEQSPPALQARKGSIDTLFSDTNPPADQSEPSDRVGPVEETRSEESGPMCEGDTKVIYDLLPEPLARGLFERINNEVSWQHMCHQGGEVPRLVAVQGQVDADGSKPVYRHPSDESPPLLPFTPAVDAIRRATEAKLGHPLNHVLIQLYRHGNDYISEHSDKTLDIARDSFIANVSLGAERTMTLRTKRQHRGATGTGVHTDGDGQQLPRPPSPHALTRQVQRARLPHNSLFQMGLATNMRWMHSIRQDKRSVREKSPAQLAYDGARISLTFRRIGTFLDSEEGRIWGQGATAKTRQEARAVVNGQTPEAVRMLRAFGRENQATEFDWEAHYGSGFDVLHVTAAARLFLSADPVVNMRVQMQLAELGVSYARGSLTAAASTTHIKYVDNDESRTAVEGERSIMLHLQTRSSAATDPNSSSPTSSQTWALERFRQGLALLDEWYRLSCSSSTTSASCLDIEAIEELLAPWETYLRAEGEGEAEEGKLMAGPTLGLADFAFWPVLHAVLSSLGAGGGTDMDANADKQIGTGKRERKLQLPRLLAYYGRIRAREAVAQMLATVSRSS